MDTALALKSIIDFLDKLRAPSWYSLLWGCAMVIWLVTRLIYLSIFLLWRSSLFSIRKFIHYPHVLPRIPLVGAATRLQFLTGAVYIAVNTLLLIIGEDSSTDNIASRAATLSVANLVPLLCGQRLLLVTRLLGISLGTNIGIHRLVGRTAIAEALIHTIILAASGKNTDWTKLIVSGVVGVSFLGLIFVLSLGLISRNLYEYFLRSHLLFSIVALVAIWNHLPARAKVERIFLQTGIIMWSTITSVQWMLFMWRNFARGHRGAKAEVEKISNALLVKLVVARPWNVRAGEYVYLSIPSWSMSALQSHPFMVAWWERGVSGLTISLLVEPRRGFTAELNNKFTSKRLLAFIDGPYGRKYNFGDYGTVVMFATDMGIAGQVPYVKDLLTGYLNCNVNTRRILLVWQMSDERQLDWVQDWINELIKQDTGFVCGSSLHEKNANMALIFEIALHVVSGGKSMPKDMAPGGKIGNHNMLKNISHAPNVKLILEKEFTQRKGRKLVSLCANTAMADEVRAVVQMHMDKEVRLVELEYQPPSYKVRDDEMDFACKGLGDSEEWH